VIFKKEEREKKPHWRQTILQPLTHIALTKKKDNTFNITTKEHFLSLGGVTSIVHVLAHQQVFPFN
jgi:hypothetical protein